MAISNNEGQEVKVKYYYLKCSLCEKKLHIHTFKCKCGGKPGNMLYESDNPEYKIYCEEDT